MTRAAGVNCPSGQAVGAMLETLSPEQRDAVRARVLDMKRADLDALAAWRRRKFVEPELRILFFELTRRCNEHCIHCGSSCGDAPCTELPVETWKRVLDEVAADFDLHRLQLAITGGEPLLYRDFFDLMEYAHAKGFRWGMTTNATLITPQVAARLADCGLGTVSVSVDGTPEQHDAFRQTPHAYERAIAGIQNLIDTHALHAIQITSVLTHANVHDLPLLYETFSALDIDSWRVINIEPIGRALQRPDLMFTREDYRYLFDFIRDKRAADMPVEYGCQHYLGLDYEREVRDWYWFCMSGVYVGSITCEGDIVGCLDVERRPDLVQGSVLTSRFSEVWRDRFEVFRQDLSQKCARCSGCEDRPWCMGGAFHSWDYDRDEPMICLKGTLWD